MSAELPNVPDVDLVLKQQWKECVFEYTVHERNRAPVIKESVDFLKASVVKNIRRFSHYRNKAEIVEYVEENWSEGDWYVLGKPIGYYQITHEGIMYFIDMVNSKETGFSAPTSSDVPNDAV